MILEIINLSCLSFLILIVWFKSDAFVEYCKLLNLRFIGFIDLYEHQKSQDFSLTYHHFLMKNFNCFFVRLITCPICFGVWISFLVSLFLSPIYMPIIFVISYMLYHITDI